MKSKTPLQRLRQVCSNSRCLGRCWSGTSCENNFTPSAPANQWMAVYNTDTFFSQELDTLYNFNNWNKRYTYGMYSNDYSPKLHERQLPYEGTYLSSNELSYIYTYSRCITCHKCFLKQNGASHLITYRKCKEHLCMHCMYI